MYFKTHINIKKIPKFCKKKLRICKKKLHCFSLFGVLYNWVKFRRLKMGDPVYIFIGKTTGIKIERIY